MVLQRASPPVQAKGRDTSSERRLGHSAGTAEELQHRAASQRPARRGSAPMLALQVSLHCVRRRVALAVAWAAGRLRGRALAGVRFP